MSSSNTYKKIEDEDNFTTEAFSDSETVHAGNSSIIKKRFQFADSNPNTSNSSSTRKFRESTEHFVNDDHESFDDFGESQNLNYKTVRTGRQRKKQAARSKGGEFQTRRKKRRVYFCCVSSEIDIQKLYDYLVGSGGAFSEWKFKLYNDVLHLYNPGVDSKFNINTPVNIPGRLVRSASDTAKSINDRYFQADTNVVDPIDLTKDDYNNNVNTASLFEENPWKISLPKAQDVFVFDFGALVFWGFAKGEEANLLNIVRSFITKGFVGVHEFQSGEDDMAFVTSNENENDSISVMNEVFTLSDDTPPKQRISISFAIAQSSVLAIFEARIEKLIEEYKYIPEALASYGKARLSENQLGKMIGEVFVIRHDVNLHSEILDTPDFFWKQENYENDYKMILNYLEMGTRTEVLNTRLDMLRELLDVLQQQKENAHSVKLEWIVIWLIVIDVMLQLIAVWGENGSFLASKK